jgi:hypothetical protein
METKGYSILSLTAKRSRPMILEELALTRLKGALLLISMSRLRKL